MTLGEFVKNYRREHNMSIRSFASMTDISAQQISNIEKGIGNDGKPMTSTMGTYAKIAKALGMTENEFLKMLNDDILVNPSEEKITATVSDGNRLYDLEEIRKLVAGYSDEEVHNLLLDLREKKRKQ